MILVHVRRLIGAVVVMATAVTVLSAAPASAAGCFGHTCNGRNPVAMGCGADAVTINHVTQQDNASGGTFGRQVVQLRYSRRCNASWARVIASAGGTAHVTSSSAYMGGFSSTTRRTIFASGSVYSNMRAGSAVNACGRTSFNHGNVVFTNCATAG
jgi:hypothetical protein